MIELDWAKFEILNKNMQMHLKRYVYIFLADMFIQSVLVQILIRLDWRQNQLNIKGNSMASNLNISVRVWIINK